MRTLRFTVFGLILVSSVAFAVSTLVAQERSRPRVMMLDGRGGQLGVSVRDLDAEGLKAAGGATGGVRIEDVDQESAAAKAGLKEGDIVVEVDGERVRSARQFSRLIQETPDGKSVKLGIVRGGSRQSIDVTPESRAFGFGVDGDRIGRDIARGLRDLEPQLRDLEPRLRELEPRLRELEPRLRERLRELEPRMREFRFDGPFNFDMRDGLPRMSSPRSRLGVQLGDLTPQLAEYFGAKDGGVLVSSVGSESPAAKAGIKAGDVITAINGDRVRNSDDLIDELRNKSGEVTFSILRDRKELAVKATIEATPTRRPGIPIV